MTYYQNLLKEAQKSEKILNKIDQDEAQLKTLQKNVDSLTAYGRESMAKTEAQINHLSPVFDHYLSIEKSLLRHQLNYEPSKN